MNLDLGTVEIVHQQSSVCSRTTLAQEKQGPPLFGLKPVTVVTNPESHKAPRPAPRKRIDNG